MYMIELLIWDPRSIMTFFPFVTLLESSPRFTRDTSYSCWKHRNLVSHESRFGTGPFSVPT